MNNQAAQTMPELPEPFDSVRVNDFSPQEAPVFSAGQMRSMYQQGYAAALSQTAGVPSWIVNDLGELGVMVNGVAYFLYKGDNIVYEDAKHDDGSPMMYRMVGKREFGEVCRPRHWEESGWAAAHRYTQELVYTPGLSFGKPKDGDWRPLPAKVAAPAASGVHPDALPDGTLSKSTAKRVTALAAASVSERARELLAAEYSKCGMQQCAADIRSGVFAAAQQLAVNAIKAALEQSVPNGEVAIVCDWKGADPFPAFIEAEVGGKSVSLA